MSNPLKVIFAGTPDFAVQALQSIIQAGFEVCMVLTQPDRPKGRGMKPQASAVKNQALQLNLPIMQPTTLKNNDIQVALSALNADVMIVVAYGLIIPPNILKIPRLGCLNIHASLLPRWRGAAPIQRAIEAGDNQSGITIMQMDTGLDTGGIVDSQSCTILPTDTAQSLHDRLAKIGSEKIVAVLQHINSMNIQPQSSKGVTYAHKLTKENTQIDWSLPASIIERKIRAFNPVPGAWTLMNQKLLKIWSATALNITNDKYPIGSVHCNGRQVTVVCANHSVLEINEWQLSGSKRMRVVDFLRGHTLADDLILGV